MLECFSAAGTGSIDRVTGIIDSQENQDILRGNIMPSEVKFNLDDLASFYVRRMSEESTNEGSEALPHEMKILRLWGKVMVKE